MLNDYLQLKNVSLSYHTKEGETLAIKDISLSVKKNEYISIVGPSGCGKTTLLSLISGLLKPSGGQVLFEGKQRDSDTQIGYMFQRDNLFEWRTIYKNIILGLEIKNKHKDKECLKRADELLDKYGLIEFKNSYPSELSGGMRQRVALIRTLVLKPKVLLLDEPFSALDYQTKLNVCDDVHSIITKEKQTVIAVTHDIGEAISMSDRVAILSKRPATLKCIKEINLQQIPMPLKRRESPEFSQYFDEIWREIANEEKAWIFIRAQKLFKEKKDRQNYNPCCTNIAFGCYCFTLGDFNTNQSSWPIFLEFAIKNV